jgi:hypothetical protein
VDTPGRAAGGILNAGSMERQQAPPPVPVCYSSSHYDQDQDPSLDARGCPRRGGEGIGKGYIARLATDKLAEGECSISARRRQGSPRTRRHRRSRSSRQSSIGGTSRDRRKGCLCWIAEVAGDLPRPPGGCRHPPREEMAAKEMTSEETISEEMSSEEMSSEAVLPATGTGPHFRLAVAGGPHRLSRVSR